MHTVQPTGGMVIRRASIADAEELARFGARTWSETFGAWNTPEDLELYLSQTYRPDLQTAELGDPSWTTLLAEEGNRLAGFAQVRTGPTPPCVTGPEPIELYRFEQVGIYAAIVVSGPQSDIASLLTRRQVD